MNNNTQMGSIPYQKHIIWKYNSSDWEKESTRAGYINSFIEEKPQKMKRQTNSWFINIKTQIKKG
jgi:hypothetical protein